MPDDREQYEARIQRSVKVYKRMKEDHFFLTSTSDYPLAVLLAGQQEEIGPTYGPGGAPLSETGDIWFAQRK